MGISAWREKIAILHSEIRAKLPTKTWLIIHMAVCAIAANGFVAAVPRAFANLEQASQFDILFEKLRYAEWIRPFFFPYHKFTIFGFVVTVALVSMALLAIQVILNSRIDWRSRERVFPSILLLDVVFLVAMINAIGSRSIRPTHVMGLLLLWAIVVALPFINLQALVKFMNLQASVKVITAGRFGLFLLLFGLIEFAAIMIPFILGKVPIINEYFEIPSTTYVRGDRNQPLRAVDTLDFINANRVFGNQLLYDPRKGPGWDPRCLEGNNIGHVKDSVRDTLLLRPKAKYYENNLTRELCLVGLLGDEDYELIRRRFLQSTADAQVKLSEFENTYATNYSIYRKFNREAVDPEVTNFIRNNRLGFVQTIHDLEMTFHHHFQFLNPIKEYALGRPVDTILAPYGMNYIGLHYIINVFGGLTYERFLGLMFSTYLVYNVVFAMLVLWITRSYLLTALTTMSAFAAVKGLGTITLFTGLGYTPVRHALDLFVIAALFAYFRRLGWIWLILAAVAAIGGIWADRLFGTFVLAAFLGTLFVRIVCGHGRRWFELAILAGTSVIGLTSVLAVGRFTAANPYAEQFLEGIWGFPLRSSQLALGMLLYVAGYVAFSFALYREYDDRKYIVLFLIFYSLMYVLYWLIVPNYGHLYAMIPWVAFSVAVFVRFIAIPTMAPRYITMLSVGLTALVGALWLGMSAELLRSSIDYWSYVRSHQIYEWPFARMKIRSVMAPDLFKEAADLIARYSERERGVYILSQYDQLLTFLADRYSNMPHFEIGTYLNSLQHIDLAAAAIRDAKPRFLVVDTCVSCSWGTIVFTRPLPFLDPVYQSRAADKVLRLRLMNDVFKLVSADYVLKEKGTLVSVYERLSARVTGAN